MVLSTKYGRTQWGNRGKLVNLTGRNTPAAHAVEIPLYTKENTNVANSRPEFEILDPSKGVYWRRLYWPSPCESREVQKSPRASTGVHVEGVRAGFRS